MCMARSTAWRPAVSSARSSSTPEAPHESRCEFGQPAKEPSLPAVIAVIEACRKPVVGALHGSALGGALEVALACDARMALAGTVLGLPEVTLGVVPWAGGTRHAGLPRRIGLVRGIEMIGRGERIASDAGVAGISRWMRVHAWRTSDRFGVEGSAAMGRVLPTADVGYAVGQLGSQLCGREISHPTGAGRPTSDLPLRG
jgi:Enoyl-CoA hydratase/isomerase